MFFGRSAVMAKGLGNTVEEEHLPGLHLLSRVSPHHRLQLNWMLTVMNSILKVKLASFLLTPLRMKLLLGSMTLTPQTLPVPAYEPPKQS